MPSNTTLNSGSGGDKVVTKQVAHDGDTSKLQVVALATVSGTEDAYTMTDISNTNPVPVTIRAGANTIGNVGITSGAVTLAAGANAIGSVTGAVSLAAGANAIGSIVLAAGSNTIGNISVTLGTTVLGAGTNAIGSIVNAAGANLIGSVINAAGANTIGNVGITSGSVTIGAGANGIGSVVLAAGSNTIGNFSGAFTLTAGANAIGSIVNATGANTIGNVGVLNLVQTMNAAVNATSFGVPLLGKRVDTPAVVGTNGNYHVAQFDSFGNLRVNITAGANSTSLDDAAFSPGVTEVVPVGLYCDETGTDPVDEGDVGAARMTTDRKAITAQYAHTVGGWLPYSYIAVGTTEDKTVVKNTPGQVGYITATNSNTSPRYLKLYDKSTAPAVGSDVPVQRYLIPSSNNGFTLTLGGSGVQFSNGISFVIVTGSGDTDGTEVAAGDVILNLGYK